MTRYGIVFFYSFILKLSSFISILKHINGAESTAAQISYQKCRTGSNPLHWSSFCADQDASTAAAIQNAVEMSGETRDTNWQFCQIHTQKSSHRKFSRESQSKTSVSAIALPSVDGLACPGCQKLCRNRAGLTTHRRFCKSIPPTSANTPSPHNPFDPLLNNFTVKEAKAYKNKVSRWLLMRKNRELGYGVVAFRGFKCNYGANDVYLKTRLKQAASSIIGCIQADHNLCARFSFVCKDGVDPYVYLLPHGRPILPLPPSVRSLIQESVNDIFCTSKLDRLLYRGRLQTTSHVEAVHRTIRQAAPKVRSRKSIRILAIPSNTAASPTHPPTHSLTHSFNLSLSLFGYLLISLFPLSTLCL